MSKKKNTYNNQYDKLLKNASKLQQFHVNEIKTLLENQEKMVSDILQKISKDFNIPMSKLLKYSIKKSKKILIDEDESSDEEETNDKEEMSVLVKITINGKSYYADKEKCIIYKTMKNKKVKEVGVIDQNGEYVLN